MLVLRISGERSMAEQKARAICPELRGRVAASVAFEEAVIAVLSQGAANLRAMGHYQTAADTEAAVRHHRVGLIKHRAIMGAHGIDV